MRINKIQLINYRPFINEEFVFDDNKDYDLYSIRAINGTGKTSILNAINWCLFDDEPHSLKNSDKLPIINTKLIDKPNYGQIFNVSVEVLFTNKDNNFSFTRTNSFRIDRMRLKNENPLYPCLMDKKFEAIITDSNGNSKIYKEEYAQRHVERIIPRNIREFFFFDGERLQQYFEFRTSQNIKNGIFQISKIDLLERVEDKLEKINRGFQVTAGRLNPKIEETRNKLEFEKGALNNITIKLDNINDNYKKAIENIDKLNVKLKNIPDIKLLQEEKLDMEGDIKRFEGQIESRRKEKNENIYNLSKLAFLWPAINISQEKIRKKRENGEIPININIKVLQDALENDFCDICGRPLDQKSRKKITSMMDGIKISSSLSSKLINLENRLDRFNERKGFYKKSTYEITKNIYELENNLSILNKRKEKINTKISGYNVDEIVQSQNQLKEFEITKENCIHEKAKLNIQIDQSIKERDRLQRIFNEEVEKSREADEVGQRILFCQDALSKISKLKSGIINDTRSKIEKKANELFQELIWKKTFYKEIKIDPEYNIKLFNEDGYSCLGSASAAETELLALSFMLAIHKVSGFEAPIIIDTPVARVSDKNRENMGKIFLEVSKERQLILLFLPEEYTQEISGILDSCFGKKFLLKMSPDEKQSYVEVI